MKYYLSKLIQITATCKLSVVLISKMELLIILIDKPTSSTTKLQLSDALDYGD